MRRAEPSPEFMRASASARCVRRRSVSPPHTRSASPAFNQPSAPAYASSCPAMAASDSTPPHADTSAPRSAPTRTKVPLESLKSSASRPSNISPWFGSSSSTSLPASPVR